MATALQQQLATIARNSTHQLDLKAQKSQHAVSILLEPREAARQTFDDIYQICSEGFEELCALDKRFKSFSSNLFGPDSVRLDRTQLTAQESKELDGLLDTFLGLLQGRLLLRPAQKSLEWLVRRFRVHVYNIQSLLLTTLPYHTQATFFPIILSTLKTQELPECFRWLHPYVSSLQSPPRHALLQALVNIKNGFFAALNTYTLRLAKLDYASSILLSFWAGIMAQAVNSMLDSARSSGRENVRREREEDVLLKALPLIQDCLGTCRQRVNHGSGSDELFVGTCMIVTILVSKASVDDKVSAALLEAITMSWSSRTKQEGITCLALVADVQQKLELPRGVTKKLLRTEDLVATLTALGRVQSVEKLVVGLIIGTLALSRTSKYAGALQTVQQILATSLVNETPSVTVLEHVLLAYHEETSQDSRSNLANVLSGLLQTALLKVAETNDEEPQNILKMTARKLRVNVSTPGVFPLEPDVVQDPTDTERMDLDVHNPEEHLERFSSMLDALPALPAEPYSFLGSFQENGNIWSAYYEAFLASLSSETTKSQFAGLPQLHRNSSASRPEYLSFLARVWSSQRGTTLVTASAMCSALDLATAAIRDENLESADLQALLPFVVTALADEHSTVRRSAARLCRAIQSCSSSEQKPEHQLTWAKDVLYDTSGFLPSRQDLRMSRTNAQSFLQDAVAPTLEEAVLSGDHIIRALAQTLDSAATQAVKGMKKSLRLAACISLASHAAATPSINVKICLLRILSSVGSTGGQARKSVLMPYIRAWADKSNEEVRAECQYQGFSVRQIDSALMANLNRRSDDELELLLDIGTGAVHSQLELVEAAHERLVKVWNNVKDEGQRHKVLQRLLGLACAQPTAKDDASGPSDLGLSTLRSLSLSSTDLEFILQSLPRLSTRQAHLTSQNSARKRRRLSSEARVTAMDELKLDAAIERMTLVLDLVEASLQAHKDVPFDHSGLIKSLFETLSELRQYRQAVGSELAYLHRIVLDAILVLLPTHNVPDAKTTNVEAIRTDLVVDIVRTTTAPEVKNSALKLVGALAVWKPDRVLHSVMPLFTFMSSTLMSNQDEHSSRIADQTVARIIPSLAASLRGNSSNQVLTSNVCELLLSFVAAWEHIPRHRRLSLYRLLVESVGPQDCLGPTVAMLLERCSGAHETEVYASVKELIAAFDVEVGLSATKQILDLIKQTAYIIKQQSQVGAEASLTQTLLSLNDKSEMEKEEMNESLLLGVASSLSDAGFRRRIAAALKNDATSKSNDIRSSYSSLLEEAVQLSTQHLVASDASARALTAILNLLPTSEFIASSANLMQAGSDSTRQLVFRSLDARIQDAKASDKQIRELFIDALPGCTAFLRQDQSIGTRIAAISCVDAISEKYGKIHRAAVFRAAETVAGSASFSSEEQGPAGDRLRVMATLCLASMITVLGDEATGLIPEVLQKTLKLLQVDKQDRQIQSAGFGLFNAVLDTLPWMLSGPQLDKTLLMAASARGQTSTELEFHSLAASKVSLVELLPALNRTWDAAMQDSKEGIQTHLSILRATIQHHTKMSIAQHASAFFGLLLQAFDLRRHTGDVLENEVPAQVDELALELTLKLNDATFRPFFARLAEWAASDLRSSDSNKPRITSLFSFSSALFNRLQGLVTSYTAFLLDLAVQVLRQPNLANDVLRRLVLQTLSASFQGDEGGFWLVNAHFEAIAQPIADQLSNTPDLDTAGVDQVKMTTVDLATAIAASPDHLKVLNTALMSHFRHRSPAVRVAAVQCQRAITTRVGLDWMSLLSEMLPAISELMEDDSEMVEREAIGWVKDVEEVTGESVQTMLA